MVPSALGKTSGYPQSSAERQRTVAAVVCLGREDTRIMRHVSYCNKILRYIHINYLTKFSVFQIIQNPYFIWQLTPVTSNGSIAGLLGGRSMLIRLAIQHELSNDLPGKMRTIYVCVCVCVCVWRLITENL